jgi:hypothetical protein
MLNERECILTEIHKYLASDFNHLTGLIRRRILDLYSAPLSILVIFCLVGCRCLLVHFDFKRYLSSPNRYSRLICQPEASVHKNT